MEQHACVNYMVGLEQMAEFYMRAAAEGPRWCVRNGVNAGQALDIMLRYLERYPMVRDRPTVVLYTLAMTDAFPCR